MPELSRFFPDKKAIGALFATTLLWLIPLFFYPHLNLAFALLGVPVLVLSVLLFRTYEQWWFVLIFSIPLSIDVERLIGDSALRLPSEALLLILFGLLILFTINGFRPIREKHFKHPFFWILAFYLLVVYVNILFTTDHFVSIKQVFIKTVFLFMFFGLWLVFFHRIKQFFKFIYCYLISFSFVIVYTLYQHSFFGFQQFASYLVSRPFYDDHTIYAASLAFIFPISIFLVFRHLISTHKQRLWWSIPLLVLLFVALLFSYSRAAWLGTIVAAVAVFILYSRHRLYFLFFVILGTSIGGVFLYQPIVEQLSKSKTVSATDFSQHLKSSVSIEADDSNKERINRWKAAFRMGMDRPITGFGSGTYQFEYGVFQKPSEMTRISVYDGSGGTAHSEYLLIFAENGFPGLLAFLGIMIGSFVYFVRLLFKLDRFPLVKQLILSLGAGLITFYVHAFFNNFLDTDYLSVLFWVFTSTIIGLDYQLTRPKSDR